MAKFTEQEFNALVHSDNQLWARSDAGIVTPELREELGLDANVEGIVKIIDAPQLGGREVWIFPADKKEFFQSFGPMVRDKVKEIENERAEKALMDRNRAALRAAEAGEDAGAGDEGHLGADERVASGGTLAVASKEAVPPSEIIATGNTSFAGRRDELVAGIGELRSYIAEANKRLRKYERELIAINAALEIMNAPEDDGTELDDAETVVEGPGESG